MPGELDRIAAVEAFKELGEGVERKMSSIKCSHRLGFSTRSEGNPVQGNP